MDEGYEQVFSRIKEIGIKHVNIATSYHCGRYLLPHNPKRRLYNAEEGVVYFQPDSKFFDQTGLKPRVSSEFSTVDIAALVTREARKHGLGVNSWTAAVHNYRLAKAHPEAAMVNAYGDIDQNFLCINNQDSRKYVIGLVRNLAEKYDFDAIQLETGGYSWGFEHGDHHEMLGMKIEPLTSDLMNICFCKNCLVQMENKGLTPDVMRKTVRSIVDISTNTPGNVLQRIPIEENFRNSYVLTADIKELYDLLRFKRDIVESFFEELKVALKASKTKAKLRLITAGGFGGAGAGMMGRGSEGINLRNLAKHVDGFDLLEYVPDPETVYYHVQWTKFEVGDCPIYVALRPSYPTLFTQQAIEAEVIAALEAGASGVEFYNYGWTSLRNLGWIKQSLEHASSRLP